MHHCHHCVTIAVGVWLQTEVRGTQYHDWRKCPPPPAPTIQGGGCCFVMVLLVRGLSWVGGEQLPLTFGWGVGLCRCPHLPGIRGVDPIPGHTVIMCLSFTGSKKFLGVLALFWSRLNDRFVERCGFSGLPRGHKCAEIICQAISTVRRQRLAGAHDGT